MGLGDFGVDRTPVSGTIVMWDDSPSNVPSGWVICDGNNGTPNLLDRFPRSVYSGMDPGVTGGQNTHTLATSQLPAHSHASPSTDTAGKHSHKVPQGGEGGWTSTNPDWTANGNSDEVSVGTKSGAHSHALNIGNTGSGSSMENRPKFYEVIFIMKA